MALICLRYLLRAWLCSHTCSKPDSGVTGTAVDLLVGKGADSCFGVVEVSTHSVETFPVTVGLQRCLRNQLVISTCYDPVRLSGIARQLSVSTVSLQSGS